MDLFFYPAPMLVSLVTHGLQAVVISVFSHHLMKKKPVLSSGIGVSVGAVIMVVGYSPGRAFLYIQQRFLPHLNRQTTETQYPDKVWNSQEFIAVILAYIYR